MSNPLPSLSLSYGGKTPEKDLLHRVLGPDTAGGLSYVWMVVYEQLEDETLAFVRPLHGKARRLAYWDDFGQQWLHHTAIDSEGRLIQV